VLAYLSITIAALFLTFIIFGKQRSLASA